MAGDAGTIKYTPSPGISLGSTNYGTNAGSILQPAGGTRYQGGKSPQQTASVSYFQPTGKVQVTANPSNFTPATQSAPSASYGGNDILQALMESNANYQRQLLELQKPVYAPAYDVAGARASAKAQAEAAQNPYYAKQLELFLQGESLKRQQQEKQTQMNIQNIEDTLSQTLEGNQINRARTAEDTQTQRTATNLQEDQMQQDTGTQFDEQRIEQARQLFVQGMLTSGAGQSKIGKSKADRNTMEQRASDQFDLTRAAQDLFQSRTFEDLAKSDDYANLAATKGREQENFSLASFIANQDIYKEVQAMVTENERQQAVQRDTGNYYSTALNNWIQNIRDPRQQVAARAAYGS